MSFFDGFKHTINVVNLNQYHVPESFQVFDSGWKWILATLILLTQNLAMKRLFASTKRLVVTARQLLFTTSTCTRIFQGPYEGSCDTQQVNKRLQRSIMREKRSRGMQRTLHVGQSTLVGLSYTGKCRSTKFPGGWGKGPGLLDSVNSLQTDTRRQIIQ